MKLRPYQNEAVTQIRARYAMGVKRVLYHAATGSGKTVVFVYIALAAAAKGKKILVVTRGIKIVQQAHERLQKEGLVCGMIQGKNTYNLHLPVIVASIDSLYSKSMLPDADMILIDECHLSFGAGYEWLLDHYSDKYILGLSATPHSPKGMAHIADAVVHVISVKELTEQGFLSPLRYFAPSSIDRKELKKSSTGDYTEKSMTEVMTEKVIMGDIVQNWLDNGENRPTFLFCSSIKHSHVMCERFREAGVKIEHIDANTKDDDRKAILARLVSRETQIVSNVNVLTVGVDVPSLSCLIVARPTLSYNLHIQMLGRATRIDKGKKDALIFDHVGNVITHGFIENEKPCQLEPTPKSARKEQREKIRTITCEDCLAVYPWEGNGAKCPACGNNNVKQDRKHKEDKAFRLEELKREAGPEWLADLRELAEIAKRNGYLRGWVFHRLKTKHGESVAHEAWPKIISIRGLRKKDEKNSAAQQQGNRLG